MYKKTLYIIDQQNWTERIGSPHTQAPNIATSTCVPNFEESPQKAEWITY